MSLNEKLEYIELEFDSYDTSISFNDNYTSDNWPLFRLARPISDIAAMKIVSAEIPFSYYVVNSINRFFVLNIGGIDFTIPIPVGNYTGTSLAAIIQATMPPLYFCTFSSTTNRLTFTTTIPIIPNYLRFGNSVDDDGQFNLRYVMGFGPYISSTFTAGTPLVAPFVLQISGPNYLYVNSKLYGQSFNLFLGNGASNNGQNGPQLCKFIVVNVW
jgi:hypothetical protein